MREYDAAAHERYPDPHHDLYSRTTFGIWLYLLSDLIMFGALFATYAVLHPNTYGGPAIHDLIDIPFAFFQTIVLLVSSLTIGLGATCAHRREKWATIAFLGITFMLGIVFIWMELVELLRLVHTGNGWKSSGGLSAYFTLIGTHGIHILLALLWLLIFLFPIWREGITPVTLRRVTCLKMFWQFLNIIWLFIFSFVYLPGVAV